MEAVTLLRTPMTQATTRDDARGTERRINRKLVSYWEGIRGARDLPEEADVDIAALADIWEHCFLLEVADVKGTKGHNCRFSYLGQAIIEAYGDDLTGRNIYDSLLATNNPEFLEKLDKVLASKMPIVEENTFMNLKNLTIHYRQCFLPLGKEGKVTHVLGGMRWRVDSTLA
jgi:hypothetical protein